MHVLSRSMIPVVTSPQEMVLWIQVYECTELGLKLLLNITYNAAIPTTITFIVAYLFNCAAICASPTPP